MWKNLHLKPWYMNLSKWQIFSKYCDSVITCNEIIGETKPIPTNFIEKKSACKTQNLSILLILLLITITLLIVLSC